VNGQTHQYVTYVRDKSKLTDNKSLGTNVPLGWLYEPQLRLPHEKGENETGKNIQNYFKDQR